MSEAQRVPQKTTSAEDREWQVIPLGEATENFDSMRVPVKGLDRKPGPFPYYGASGIIDHVDGYIFDGEYLLVAEDGENLRTRKTPIAFMAQGKFWANNHVHIIRGNHLANTRYLCYLLSVTDISGYITGSTQPKLSQANLNRIPVRLPSIETQQRVVSVLDSLGDKIELNRRMNRTLEGIVRAIFKSWFIDFDPVHATAEGRELVGMDPETAALFPDSFQDSSLGMIPKGWEVKPLSEVCLAVIRGVTPKYEVGSRRFIINQRVNRGSYLDRSCLKELSHDLEVPDEKMANAFDVLLNSLGEGTIGRVHLFRGPSATYAVDQHMTICRCGHAGMSSYIYQYLASPLGQQRLHSLKSGSTTMTMLNVSKLRAFSVPFPRPRLINRYWEAVSALWSAIAESEQQIDGLVVIRDTLLPKLISGDLRVKDAKRFLERSRV